MQSCRHIETSHLICKANQLTGFCMMATLAFNKLMRYKKRQVGWIRLTKRGSKEEQRRRKSRKEKRYIMLAVLCFIMLALKWISLKWLWCIYLFAAALCILPKFLLLNFETFVFRVMLLTFYFYHLLIHRPTIKLNASFDWKYCCCKMPWFFCINELVYQF